MAPHHRHLSALSLAELNTLAALLNLPPRLLNPATGRPSDLWLATQARQLRNLPKPLRRPSNWLSRLSIATNRALRLTLEDLVPQCAVLCSAHRELNPWVARRVFFLLSDELTQKLDMLRRVLRRPWLYKLDQDSFAAIKGLVERLSDVLALWMPGYRMQCRFPRIASGCEACVVAAVGAQGDVLRDLRAVLLGRSHHGRTRPALLRMVEAWIGLLEREQGTGVERQSEKLARVVKRVRKAVQERRKGRKGQSRGETRGEQYSPWPVTCSREPPAGAARLPTAYAEDANFFGTAAIGQQLRRPSKPTAVDTMDGILHAYGSNDVDEDEDEPLDELYDETDPRTARHLQDSSRQWYSTHSKMGEQHPAFRQSATDIEALWTAQSRVTMSAMPPPLRASCTQSNTDDMGEQFDPSQWTDVSAQTSADGAGVGSHGVSGPGTPSLARTPFILSHNGSIILAKSQEWNSAIAPSSFYSQDGEARQHPSLPPGDPSFFDMPSPVYEDVPAFSGSSKLSSRLMMSSTVLSPPAGETFRRGQAPSTVPSQATVWPGPNAPCGTSIQRQASHSQDVWYQKQDFSMPSACVTAWPRIHNSYQVETSHLTSNRSRYRHSSSTGSAIVTNTSASAHHDTSNSSLSAAAFQSALDHLNEARDPLQGSDSAFNPEGTVLPNDSISVVAGLREYEARARPLQNKHGRPPGRMGFRFEDGVETDDDDEYLRAARDRNRGGTNAQEEKWRRKERR